MSTDRLARSLNCTAGEESTDAGGALHSATQSVSCQPQNRETKVELVATRTQDHPPAQVGATQAQAVSGEEAQCPVDDEWGMLNSESIAANASVMRHLTRVAVRKHIACKAPQHPQ